MANIGKVVADAIGDTPKKGPLPMEVPDDLAALGRQVGEQASDRDYIRDSASHFRTKARINRDGSLRSGSEQSGPGLTVLQKLVGAQDERGLADAVRNIRDFRFTKDGSGAGGTGTLVEALTKPAWQHSGRQVKIVHMDPMEYLARSAKGHGLTQEELLQQLAQGDRTDKILEGMAEGQPFAMPYLDYRNGGFGQEGQHRAMAAAMAGHEKIPVAVMWNDVKAPVAAKAEPQIGKDATVAGAAGATVALAQPDSAQAGTNPQGHPEMAQIAIDEGSRQDAKGRHRSYVDTKGYLTGGIGHLMTKEEQAKYPKGTVIPDSVVEKWFQEDMAKHSKEAEQWLKGIDVPEEVQNIVTNMMFNMGMTRMNGFKKFKEALEAGDWEKAADEMEDSKWYTDVGNRSKRLIARMRRVR